jgi:hypothetical protein
MAEALLPRLDELSNLTKKLNSTADRLATVVQGVEAHLGDICRLGMHASVVIESESNPDEDFTSTTCLVYGRYQGKYRIHIVEVDEHCGSLVSDPTETLWANCSRDLKLASFRKLPELLDKMIAQVKETIEQVEVNAQDLEAVISLRGHKKKEALS